MRVTTQQRSRRLAVAAPEALQRCSRGCNLNAGVSAAKSRPAASMRILCQYHGYMINWREVCASFWGLVAAALANRHLQLGAK